MTAVLENPVLDRDYIEVDAEVAEKIGRIKVARKHARGWAALRDELTAEIKDLLAGSKGAVHDGRIVATVKERAGRRVVDMDLLKALVDEDTYDKVVKSGAVQVVLDLP